MRKRHWVRWISSIVLAVLFVLAVVFNLLFQIDYTKGISMSPTLENGEMLVVWRPQAMKVLGVRYHRKDIVVVENEETRLGLKAGDMLVKRLIGLPGETVDMGRTTVGINGKTLNEPYVVNAMDNETYSYGGMTGGGSFFQTQGYTDKIHLTKDQYYLLGDNRPQSADSRWFGPIKTAQLRGKVQAILLLNYNHFDQRLVANLLVAAPFFLLVFLIVVNGLGRTPYGSVPSQDQGPHRKA